MKAQRSTRFLHILRFSASISPVRRWRCSACPFAGSDHSDALRLKEHAERMVMESSMRALSNMDFLIVQWLPGKPGVEKRCPITLRRDLWEICDVVVICRRALCFRCDAFLPIMVLP